MGEKIDQVAANICDFFTKLALELFGGGAQCQIGTSANQVDHGFGLGQVHFAIEKSALGEFSGTCSTRTRAETSFENFRRHQCSTMAANLDKIVAGVTGRRAMDRHHDLVDQVSGFADDLAQMLHVRGKFRRQFFAPENFVRD